MLRISICDDEQDIVCLLYTSKPMVAPLAGAWIEIDHYCVGFNFEVESLPSRERGLKFLFFIF